MANAQADAKTNLSLQVSQACAANRAQLVQYVWTRTVQVYMDGTLKSTMVSSMSFSPQGKLVATDVSTTPTSAPKRGLRGAIAKDKIDDLKTYIDTAMKVSMTYIYMNKGNMVNFFDKASINQTGSELVVLGNSINQPGDQLDLKLNSQSLAYISQDYSTTVNGDAVSGNVTYKTFDNGLTAVDAGAINLPAKNIKIVLSNSGYAKKLM